MDIKQFKQTQFMQAKIAHNNFVLLQAPNYVTKALSTWMKELADDTESPFAENVNVEDAVNVGLVNVRNKN